MSTHGKLEAVTCSLCTLIYPSMVWTRADHWVCLPDPIPERTLAHTGQGVVGDRTGHVSFSGCSLGLRERGGLGPQRCSFSHGVFVNQIQATGGGQRILGVQVPLGTWAPRGALAQWAHITSSLALSLPSQLQIEACPPENPPWGSSQRPKVPFDGCHSPPGRPGAPRAGSSARDVSWNSPAPHTFGPR